MVVARTQTLVQLTDELVALLDQRAARTRRSRSELVREAIEAYLAEDVQADIGRRIVEGYTRFPQADDDEFADAAQANAQRAVREEPW
jgi:metal-responsive CopG/Arc/MetJ family transcriptional regulator